MPEYLTPGVYFEYCDQVPVVRGLRTDIAGFVGLAERGPLNEPVRIESWRQFQSQFGNFLPYGFLAYAVKGFFENGGRTCFIVRVAGRDAAKATCVLKNKSGKPVIVVNAASEGTWGNKISLALTTRASDKTFSLRLFCGGSDCESFKDLSINAADQNYFVRIINEGNGLVRPSRMITVHEAENLFVTDELLPDTAASGLKNGIGLLANGKDGIVSLMVSDLLGSSDLLSSEQRGLNALGRIDAVAIICIPDMHIAPVPLPPKPPQPKLVPCDPCLPRVVFPSPAIPIDDPVAEQPPRFSEQDVNRIQRTMIEHCEQKKDRVAVIDAPLKPGKRSMTLSEIRTWRSKLETQRGFGALYYPWIKVIDPLTEGNAPVKAVPACGHVAGLYAGTDLTIGVHKAPANAELAWAEDIAVSVNDEQQAVLNPEGINCIRPFPGRGIRVYGVRTLSSDPDWRFVNVRRLMIMIEEAVDKATQWAVFEPHTVILRQTLVMSVSTFLETLWRSGALKGTEPEEAFYVKCDETNNPPDSVDQGRLIVDIGVAPTVPAEFIVFRVGRTLEELEIVER